jgi:hypothetical protein
MDSWLLIGVVILHVVYKLTEAPENISFYRQYSFETERSNLFFAELISLNRGSSLGVQMTVLMGQLILLLLADILLLFLSPDSVD